MTNQNNETKGRMVNRVLIVIIGLLFLSFGVVLSINSNLGITPITSLPYIISMISGTSLGLWVIITSGIYILLQAVVMRKSLKIVNLTQLLFSIIFGYFVDLAKWIVGDFSIPIYPGRLLMLLISIALIAFGVLLYIEANLITMPPDALALTLAEKTGISFHNAKVIVDSVTVAFSIVLSFIFYHKLMGIREGTIITAVVVGKLVGLLRRPLSPIIKKLCGQIIFEPQADNC